MITYNGHILLTPSGKWYTVNRHLPPFTIRLLYKDGVIPTFSKGTGVQVSQNPNVWDLTYNNTNWDYILYNHSDLLAIMGANTTGVTSLYSACQNCSSLTTVALFDTSSVQYMHVLFAGCINLNSIAQLDTSNVTTMYMMFDSCKSLVTIPQFNTSNVTDMGYMFNDCDDLEIVPLLDTSKVSGMNAMFSDCISLKNIPLFNTSSVIYMDSTFNNCTKVESGALTLYNQVSSQSVPPVNHYYTFRNCGLDTVTGAAELAQIPSDWK